MGGTGRQIHRALVPSFPCSRGGRCDGESSSFGENLAVTRPKHAFGVGRGVAVSDLEGQCHRRTPLCGQAELGPGGAGLCALRWETLEIPSPGGLAIIARSERGGGASN